MFPINKAAVYSSNTLLQSIALPSNLDEIEINYAVQTTQLHMPIIPCKQHN